MPSNRIGPATYPTSGKATSCAFRTTSNIRGPMPVSPRFSARPIRTPKRTYSTTAKARPPIAPIKAGDTASPGRQRRDLRDSAPARQLQDECDDHDGRERQRQEDLPAEPHQLIVTVTRHYRLHHGDEEEQEADLQHEPDDAR